MKQALTINAIFSGASGILLIAFPNWFANRFNLQSATPFWIVGIALAYFTVTIAYEIKKLNLNRILWIIAQDLLWVIGSIYILTLNPFSISMAGNITIAVVTLIVLLMAINQFVELRKLRIR